jgi:hypothetical protein
MPTHSSRMAHALEYRRTFNCQPPSESILELTDCPSPSVLREAGLFSQVATEPQLLSLGSPPPPPTEIGKRLGVHLTIVRLRRPTTFAVTFVLSNCFLAFRRVIFDAEHAPGLECVRLGLRSWTLLTGRRGMGPAPSPVLRPIFLANFSRHKNPPMRFGTSPKLSIRLPNRCLLMRHSQS